LLFDFKTFISSTLLLPCEFGQSSKSILHVKNAPNWSQAAFLNYFSGSQAPFFFAFSESKSQLMVSENDFQMYLVIV
jgi:hypothetical protein